MATATDTMESPLEKADGKRAIAFQDVCRVGIRRDGFHADRPSFVVSALPQ